MSDSLTSPSATSKWWQRWPKLWMVALALEVGVIFFQAWRQLPPLWPVGLLGLVSLGVACAAQTRWRVALLPGLAAAAFLWSGFLAEQHLAQALPGGRTLTVIGRVADIPQEHDRQWQWQIAPDQIAAAGRPLPRFPARIQVHGSTPEIPVTGQRWALTLRTEPLASLRQSPHQDLPRRRFWEGLLGTGKILSAQPLTAATRPQDILARARLQVIRSTNAALPRAEAGYLQALSIGIGNQIPRDTWQVYRDTGTAHLLVISGSHVAVVTGFWMAFWRFWWRRSPLAARWPAPQAAVLAGIPVAWIYAWLAGMQMPGERAAWMITAAALAAVMGRRHGAWHGLLVAAAGMALVNPGAVVDLGYWLSLLAVAILISVGFAPGQWRQVWQAQWHTQWNVSVLLLPLMAFLFGTVSLISPLANLVVIPLVELLAVPLALMGSAAALVDAELLSRVLFRLAALEMEGVTRLLQILLQVPGATVLVAKGHILASVGAASAFALFLLPRRWPGRWWGILGLIPLLAPQPGGKGMELAAIPAGQGMAVWWRNAQGVSLFTANLWAQGDRRVIAQGVETQLQAAGERRLQSWISADLSAPRPVPLAASRFIPPRSRWPELQGPSTPCTPDRAPAGMRFFDLGVAQPCVLSLDGDRVLLLGDMDEDTLHRLLQAPVLARAQVILAPASLATEQQRLTRIAPQARVQFLGHGLVVPWHWRAGRLESSAPTAPAYWELP